MSATLFGWLVPILPILLSPESEFQMSLDDASWVVTIPELGTLISALPAGFMADRFGRKTVLLTITPIVLIGWGLIIYYKTFPALIVARIIQSLAIGITFTIVPMYLGEIASPQYRGAISSMFSIFWWLGYPYEFVLGSLLNYDAFTYTTAFTSVAFFFAFLWQPESPYFYLMKNDISKAKKSLSWFLYIDEAETNQELDRIKRSIDEEQKKKGDMKELLATPTNRKAMIILILVGFLRVFCGLIPLLSYSTETLVFAGDDFVLSPNNVTIFIGVFIVVGSICSFFLIDYFGRISLLLFSCSISGIMMFSIGTFYLLKSYRTINVSSFTWVPPICLMIFCLVASMGIFPVSVSYTSELFDSSTRANASSVMTFYTMFLGFIVLKFYFTMVIHFGIFINFYIFALSCFLGVFLALTVLPETKGKTFEQIRIELSKGNV